MKITSFFTAKFILSGSFVLFLSGCSNDGATSQQEVVIDATVPSYIEKDTTVTVPISLVYATSMPVSVNNDDTRTVWINDVSACDPKLLISPATLNIIVGAPATSFDLTAPSDFCEHIVQISVSGSPASTVSDPVTVLNSVIDVGLYTPSGYPTDSVAQGDSIIIRFTAPSDAARQGETKSVSSSTR